VISPGTPKSVPAEPGRRCTTSNASLVENGRPAAAATTAYRGAAVASASRACASFLPDRHQPGHSRAHAKTRSEPNSLQTAVEASPSERLVTAASIAHGSVRTLERLPGAREHRSAWVRLT